MDGKYILNANGVPVREPDLIRWAQWIETGKRIVKQETIGDSFVSTVFLGLDHNFNDFGPPILWETRVFSGPMSAEQDRCSGSIEQAEAMHECMVEKVRNEITRRKNPA